MEKMHQEKVSQLSPEAQAVDKKIVELFKTLNYLLNARFFSSRPKMVNNVYVSTVTQDNISRHELFAWVNGNLSVR